MSMTWNEDTDDEGRGRKLLRIAVPVIVLLLVAAGVWYMATQQSGVKRELNLVSTLMAVAPPPPPPPPPKVIEPPKPVQQVIQQPVNAPPPPQASQSAAANNAVTENAPAQAGTDAFNIGSGNGSGMSGSGLAGFAMSASQYGQYARGKILAAVRQDDSLHDKEFVAIVRVWFTSQGAISRVEITKPTGTETYDSALQKVLASLSGFNPPPANVIAQMPIQFTIDERRS